MIWQVLFTVLYGAFVGVVLGAGIKLSMFFFDGPGGRGWGDYYRRVKRWGSKH